MGVKDSKENSSRIEKNLEMDLILKEHSIESYR